MRQKVWLCGLWVCLFQGFVCAMMTPDVDILSDPASDTDCVAQFSLRSFRRKLAIEDRTDEDEVLYMCDARWLITDRLHDMPGLVMLDVECGRVDPSLLHTVFDVVRTALQVNCSQIRELFFFVVVDPTELSDQLDPFFKSVPSLSRIVISNQARARSVEMVRNVQKPAVEVAPHKNKGAIVALTALLAQASAL